MKTKIDYKKIQLEELAAIISTKLKEHGLDGILVGGACVSIYSQNRYQSFDLDYVTYNDLKKVNLALKELNFHKKGKHFVHPDCVFLIEFVSPPVAIGSEPIHHFAYHKTDLGIIKMLSPTDSVRDRLASFYYWDDKQSLDQAIAICKGIRRKVRFKEIEKWSKKEGFINKFEIFLRKFKETTG